MKKLAAKLTRSAMANVLGIIGAACLVIAAWHWDPIAGLAALGVGVLLVGWAVDE